MHLQKLFLSAVLIASVGLFSACKDYVGKEKSHPFFVKAGACKSAGNYKEAAQYFEEFLNVCPRSPLVHYELASLYNDNLDDPIKAVYHYQKYLELDKHSSDAENVEKFIVTAKKKLFESLSKQYESADTSKAHEETDMVKKRLAQYVEYSTKLREQNQKLREQNLAMRQRIEGFSKDSAKFKETAKALKEQSEKNTEEAEPEQKTAAKETPKPAAPVQEETKQQVPAKTHKVVKGDNLYNISKKYYGEKKYWTVIRDANKGKLGRNDSVRIGQVIIIPELKDKKK